MVFFTLAISLHVAISKQPSRISKRDLPPDYYGGGYDLYGGYGGYGGNGVDYNYGNGEYGTEDDGGTNIAGVR